MTIVNAPRRWRPEILQMRHLSLSSRLEEAGNPRLVHLLMSLVSVLVFAFIVWASVTQIDEVARSEGEIMPRGLPQIVQHMDGGIVTDIKVKDGDQVKKGQLLLNLDDGSTSHDLAENQTRMQGLEMQAERLKAFVENRTPDFSRFTNVTPADIEQQRRIFGSSSEQLLRERKVVADQLAQKQDSVRSLSAQRATIERDLNYSNEIVGMNEKMGDRGSASRRDVLDAARERDRLQGELNRIDQDMGQARNSINEYQSRLQALDADKNQQAYTQLDQINLQIREQGDRIAYLKARIDRLSLRSPVHGLVQGLRINTIGAVVSPGATLMQIVPLDRELIVEARVSPRDIGHIEQGQKAQVKVSAFDFIRYGTLPGTVEMISPSTFLDDQRQPYYRAQIRLDRKTFERGGMHDVLPGMTAEADIITGRKSIIAYLLKPIHLSLQTALTER